MRIAFLGNFGPEFSTENEYKWTFEQLGHSVIPLQEARATTTECLASGMNADVFCWVNTHGWQTPGPGSMYDVLETLRQAGRKSFGMHLDRYQGLQRGDGREGRVGTTPWWKMDYIFTADGGNSEFFKARSVNHYWLAPAVAKRHCYVGNFRPEFACDVAFVGARGYHPEYGFRPQLVEWLDGQRQWNVKRFGGDRPGYRGAPLNDIYASATVVVGDSCFAGAPFYWSDRVPETLGRRGFLLHPFSEGMEMPMAHYNPGDLGDLGDKIRYWLADAFHREVMQERGFEWVKEHDTYHNRVQEMFQVMGLA